MRLSNARAADLLMALTVLALLLVDGCASCPTKAQRAEFPACREEPGEVCRAGGKLILRCTYERVERAGDVLSIVQSRYHDCYAPAGVAWCGVQLWEYQP